jgi:AcrR family transcriptional regulator
VTRADVVRNRAKLVDAAREVFAERGLAATLDDIAQRAGVGTGTAYRHFRDKHELAAEVLAGATQRIVEAATDALAIDDPWGALVTFFEANAERQVADGGLYAALAGQGRLEDKVRLWPEIVATVTKLFDRAHEANVIRRDATPADAASILAMLGPVVDLSVATGTDVWRRYLGLLLDGLRATDRPRLPGPPPTFASLDDVIAASKRRLR